MILAAARRFLLILAGTASGVAVVSLTVGALVGSAAERSVSVGLYITGCLIMLVGFFVGLRGPMRPSDRGFSSAVIPFLTVPARAATPEEHRETLNMAGVYVVVGLTLLVLAVIVDSRYRLI